MKAPKIVELSVEELDALVDRVNRGEVQQGDGEIIEAMAEMIKFINLVLQEKTISIKRLRRIIFGAKTEKTETVVKKPQGEEKVPPKSTEDGGAAGGTEQEKKKRKGHGRNGAEAYRGAERVWVAHPTLKPGDPCPVCPKGKVYRINKPSVVVRVVGKPPVQAVICPVELPFTIILVRIEWNRIQFLARRVS